MGGILHAAAWPRFAGTHDRGMIRQFLIYSESWTLGHVRSRFNSRRGSV